MNTEESIKVVIAGKEFECIPYKHNAAKELIRYVRSKGATLIYGVGPLPIGVEYEKEGEGFLPEFLDKIKLISFQDWEEYK